MHLHAAQLAGLSLAAVLTGVAAAPTPVGDLPEPCLSSSLNLPDYSRGVGGGGNYAERVAALKKQSVYNPELIPLLLDHGVLHQQNGEHGAAARHFEEALLVMKVNKGLYHRGQLSVLDLLIQSRLALRNWKAVTDYYDRKQWLLRRNYASDDPAILPLLKQLRQWHSGAYDKETGRAPEQHFQIARDIYYQGLHVIRACGGTKRQAYCFWHRACCDDARPEYGVCPLDRGWWR